MCASVNVFLPPSYAALLYIIRETKLFYPLGHI